MIGIHERGDVAAHVAPGADVRKVRRRRGACAALSALTRTGLLISRPVPSALLVRLGGARRESVALLDQARLPQSGVPQLIALLAHVLRKNPCSAALGLVRIREKHRFTLTAFRGLSR